MVRDLPLPHSIVGPETEDDKQRNLTHSLSSPVMDAAPTAEIMVSARSSGRIVFVVPESRTTGTT